MEIQVSKLRQVLELLKPAVPRKPMALKVLSNVLFKDGQAVATNLESMIIARLPEADQAVLLPYHAVLETLKYVAGGELLKVESKGGKVMLSWSTGSASYSMGDPKDYVPVPKFQAKFEGMLDSDTLIPALSAALPYTATETDRPILNGITVILGNPIEVAAGDGFRMSHQVLPLSFPVEETIIIPSDAVAVLAHVCAKTPRSPLVTDTLIPALIAKRQVHVGLDGNGQLRVGFGQAASVLIKLIQGNPPAWLQLIPKEEPVLHAQVYAPEFETAVRRVRDVATSSAGIVRMVFNEGTVTVSAKGEDREVEATIFTLATKGTPNKVAVNVRYLLDYLAGREGIVSVSWTGKNAPVLFQHQKSPRVLIMPMFVEWDNKPSADTQPEAIAAVSAPTEQTPEAQREEPQDPPADVVTSSQVSMENANTPKHRSRRKKS